jgi:hypothetical protein
VSPSSLDRIDRVLGFPHELLAYERWLDEQRKEQPERDYLFAEERCRFEPRKDDVVVPSPGVAVKKSKGSARLVAGAAAVELRSVSAKEAERILAAMDGERCLIEVRWDANVSATTLSRFLRATFGALTFAPYAVARLEAELSGVEIVRFPAPPYCIERPYWDNMIAVRRAFETGVEALATVDGFVAWLRRLHVIALMGESLQSYYKPQSPVAEHTVAPGALFDDPPRTIATARGTVYLDGPRVKVPFVGGEGYHRALCAELGDEAALAPERNHSIDGVPWGRVIRARSERESTLGPWFCPPRPITPAHWAYMRDALAAAWSAAPERPDESIAAVARFHAAWVRLHPFHCANQSLAMNIVNAVLARARGAGIPHLVLDHLALRLDEAAYLIAFARAVAHYAEPEADPVARLRMLSERKQRSFAVMRALDEGRQVDDRDGARWALLG